MKQFKRYQEFLFTSYLTLQKRNICFDCASVPSLPDKLRNLLPTTFLCFPSCQDYNCCFGWEAGRSMFAPECGDEWTISSGLQHGWLFHQLCKQICCSHSSIFGRVLECSKCGHWNLERRLRDANWSGFCAFGDVGETRTSSSENRRWTCSSWALDRWPIVGGVRYNCWSCDW